MHVQDRVKQRIGTDEHWRYGVVTENLGPYACVNVFAEDRGITTEILPSPYRIVARASELQLIDT